MLIEQEPGAAQIVKDTFHFFSENRTNLRVWLR